MNDVVFASTESDSAALEAIEQHHAQLAGALAAHVEALVSAAADGDSAAAQNAQADVVGWSKRELLPHARAEETALYPSAYAKPEGRLLIDGMLAEHTIIGSLVEEIAAATDPVRAAASATALRVIFDSHLDKENQQALPLIAAAPDMSLSALVGGMRELLGGPTESTDTADDDGCGSSDHSCTCGESDVAGYPELDARVVPHAIRHATIFGALDAVHPGGGLILVAPHDPLPLLAQLERRAPGAFQVSYVERGPEAWRLAIVRN